MWLPPKFTGSDRRTYEREAIRGGFVGLMSGIPSIAGSGTSALREAPAVDCLAKRLGIGVASRHRGQQCVSRIAHERCEADLSKLAKSRPSDGV